MLRWTAVALLLLAARPLKAQDSDKTYSVDGSVRVERLPTPEQTEYDIQTTVETGAPLLAGRGRPFRPY